MLSVKNLRIVFNTRHGQTVAVDNLHFDLAAGEVLAIVGESGSGKSVACYSLMGLVPMPPGRIESGSAVFQGQDLLGLTTEALRKIRGRKIAMIFQDPMTCLNPYMTVGDQLAEVLVFHKGLSKKEALKQAVVALDEVGIRDSQSRLNHYPHQFSGGMRQRVMIAMALLSEPDLLIADEPTTALDVTVQAQILELIKTLQRERNLGVIFITHDLAVAAKMATNVLVMEKGHVVEQGNVQDVFHHPQHPYTQKLLSAVLTTAKPIPSQANYSSAPLVKVNHLKTYFTQWAGVFKKRALSVTKSVDDVSLSIYPGEIIGLVGESGSGKSTLGRSIMRLVDAVSGDIVFDGTDLLALPDANLQEHRRDFQMIFQDPYASLNPRMTVFDTLAEPLLFHKFADESNVHAQVSQLMDEVGLDRRFVRKYPHEFSGGQRQRIAIARALAVKPKFIVADEPVSALDVTIRAQILSLLLDISQKYKVSMLFISHDISVVRYLCDKVVVMQHGKIIEVGQTESLFANPQTQYAQELLTSSRVLAEQMR